MNSVQRGARRVPPPEAEALLGYLPQALAGDAGATRALLHAVAPDVARVARAVLGAGAADLDDVVQEALLGLLHALPSFRGDCSLRRFANRIAVHCNDENADVHPTQTQFFVEAPQREWGADFDFDCDGNVLQLLTSEARDCELHPRGTACLGEGWITTSGPVPECGQEAVYQVCELKDGMCEPYLVDTVQRCR